MTLAEAASTNPYLADPVKGLQLIARLIAHPQPNNTNDSQKHLVQLHQLIHEKFVNAAARDDYPAEIQAFRELLALEESLEDLSHFPDLANKSIVGVGGGFSAGKSRFLNTLLGDALLPESLEPTTAIPSFITGGTSHIVALNAFNQQVEIDAEALQAISHAFHRHYQKTMGEQIGFAHLLKLLMIHRPDFEWNNLAFLDTPGYSKVDIKDAGQTDEKIALKQLTEADHLIWLLSAKNGSIRQDDLEFLRSLKHPQPIFFVVTQSDLVGEARILPILESAMQAIDTAGIPRAGVMAWAAPLGEQKGQRIAGDDILNWLKSLNEASKCTTKRRSCARVLDDYIFHNQSCLAKNRQKLKLLNALLPLADQLQETDIQDLRNLIQSERANQIRFVELVSEFESIKIEMLKVISLMLGSLTIEDHDDGSAEAQFQAGEKFRRGDGCDVDLEQAFSYYQKAAEQGHARAQVGLGTCYMEGEGVPLNQILAVSWILKAAKQGDAWGQCALGCVYMDGEGVPENMTLGVSWFLKSAKQGNAVAQSSLGKSYANGYGVDKDESVAVSWYAKASDQGDGGSQLALAKCYAKGVGVSKDEAIAKTWYLKAAENGNVEALRALLLFYQENKCYDEIWGRAMDLTGKLIDKNC